MENTLSPEELAYLEDLLREYLSDLRTEILDTDDHDFKTRLKRKEQVLKGLLVKIEQAPISTN